MTPPRSLATSLSLALALALLLPVLASPAPAQQLIGYVSTHDADVTGASDVMDGHAVLSGAVAVTAKDQTAPITLGRGGAVRVCQTSIVHITESKASATGAQLAAPLLLSLDRGAIEIQMNATTADAVMTPDLRFAVRTAGPLDLRLRVARNGDTCVENRGPQAPVLVLSDPFGESQYEVLPTQHVLFEHGSLREVVDRETTPCGCPDTTGMSVADALLAPGVVPGAGGMASNPPAPDASLHPFPAAVSEGLAPAAEVPQAPPGQIHAQVSDTLTYNAQTPAEPATPPAPAAAPAPPPPPPTAAAKPSHHPFRAVGHFFRKLFS